MFRAGEAENRVVHSYQELRMTSFETASERALVHVFDNIVANEVPKLARRDPDTAPVTHHFCRMFAGAGQTNTSKNFALSGNLQLEQFI